MSFRLDLVAAGPIGRTAEAGASASAKRVSIEGSVIVERKDANEAFYRQKVTAAELLSGAITPPPQADILYRALNSRASGFSGSYSINRTSTSSSGYSESGRYSPNNGVYRSPSLSNGGGGPGNGRFGSQEISRQQYGADEKVDYDPSPRYSPSSVRKAGMVAGRVSTDNNSPGALSGHQNSTIANATGPRVPPRIGQKPETVTALYDFA
ncbi:hypothetical protein BGZ94_006305, partial [Podila epigama]